jgi:hypothetical protein
MRRGSPSRHLCVDRSDLDGRRGRVRGRSWRLWALALAVFTTTAGSVWAATITGSARNDVLRGTSRADTISGRAGNDRLLGAAGDDVLLGGPGNDTLVGGRGSDLLRCGPGSDVAIRDALDAAVSGCERVRGPKPAPPPPPAPPQPPPPPEPGAPASYVFGAEVSAAQQVVLRADLDLAARYMRSQLGLDLPPFPVWAHTDQEAMVRTYAATLPTSLDDARELWGSEQIGQVANVDGVRMWVGPRWFGTAAGDRSSARRIAAHEAYHVHQYALAGAGALNGGLDDIPRAGPRWLSEGSAELVGHLAGDNQRLLAIREMWRAAARQSTATLASLATLRGRRTEPHFYGISALAVEQLVGPAGPRLFSAYFEALGRGTSWQSAFASVFGRSVDAFYAEFEAFRRRA